MKKLLSLFFALSLLVPGIALGAVGFDGTDDAETVSNPNKGATELTWCSWFWTVAWQDNGAVFSYGNHNSGSAGRGFRIRARDSGSLQAALFAGAIGDSVLLTPTGLATSTWIHVCLTVVGGDMNLYVDATDGLLDTTAAVDPGTIQDATDDIIIGQPMPASSDIGGIFRAADVAYWDKALTGAQVATLADKSVCPEDIESANLQFFSRLTTAGAVTDISPNAFTIVEAGNPTTQTDPTSLPACDGIGGGGGGGGGSGTGSAFNEGFDP